MKNNKIGKKLLICLWLIICIPILLVACIFVNIYSKSIENNIEVSSMQTLSAVNNGFDNFLNGLSQQIDVISKNDSLKSVNSNDQQNLSDIENAIYLTKKSTKDIFDIYYGLENCDMKIEADKYDTSSSSYKTEEWYTSAKNSGNSIVFSQPYFKPSVGRTIITISKNISDNGKIVGVIAMDIDIDTVKNYISTINLSNTGYIILLNENGDIVVNNVKNDVLKGNISSIPFYKDILANKNGFYKYSNKVCPMYIAQSFVAKTNWIMLGMINQKEVYDKVKTMNYIIAGITVVCLIVSMILSLILSNVIINKLKKMKNFMKILSSGDLTYRMDVTSNDEIGEFEKSFNSMADKINEFVKNIKGSSEQLLDAAVNINGMSEETTASMSQVSDASATVANGAVLQASNMQSGVECVDNLSNKIDSIDIEILNAGSLSSKADELSSQGLNIVKNLIESSDMTKINSEMYMNAVVDMTNCIDNINTISNDILDISKSTNLLSLNATIEASKAGEYGKSFAVVAAEMRKLCKRTVDCANEIQTISTEINNKITSTEEAMSRSCKMFDKQSDDVNKTKDIFNNIVDSIKLLSNTVNKIQDLNFQMKKYKSDVKLKMDDMALISEETASISQEVSASTEEVNSTMDELTSCALTLREMADKFEKDVNFFKIL